MMTMTNIMVIKNTNNYFISIFYYDIINLGVEKWRMIKQKNLLVKMVKSN